MYRAQCCPISQSDTKIKDKIYNLALTLLSNKKIKLLKSCFKISKLGFRFTADYIRSQVSSFRYQSIKKMFKTFHPNFKDQSKSRGAVYKHATKEVPTLFPTFRFLNEFNYTQAQGFSNTLKTIRRKRNRRVELQVMKLNTHVHIKQ